MDQADRDRTFPAADATRATDPEETLPADQILALGVGRIGRFRRAKSERSFVAKAVVRAGRLLAIAFVAKRSPRGGARDDSSWAIAVATLAGAVMLRDGTLT